MSCIKIIQFANLLYKDRRKAHYNSIKTNVSKAYNKKTDEKI